MAPLQNRMRPDPITVDQGAINGAPTKTVCAPESDNRGPGRHEWRPYKTACGPNPITAWARVPMPPQGAHSCAPDRSVVSFNPVRRRLTVENSTPNAR